MLRLASTRFAIISLVTSPVRYASTGGGAGGAAPTASGSGGGIDAKPPPHHDPGMDAEATEQARVAAELGSKTFEENTRILKQVGSRGLRAFVICAVGVAAFSFAMKRKRLERAADKASAGGGGGDAADGAEDGEEDPTERYLEEMRGLGFDVDTLEEELELERMAQRKGAAGRKVKQPIS